MKPIRMVSISDIHFGNRRISIQQIIDNMRSHVFPKIQQADILIIGGDWWDTQLQLNANESDIILSFMIELLRLTHQYKVIVRVLRGTFSHDRTQSVHFEMLHKQCQFTNDLKYIDTIQFDYIEKFDLKLLFVPDDLPYKSTEDCMTAIHKVLLQANWKTVDYAFTHGNFEHVFPEHTIKKQKCVFRIQDFKQFVTRYVISAHIHTRSIRDIVAYNGSFERLNHGEEEAKGFLYIIDDGINARLEFVENTNTTKFLTIDLSHFSNIDVATKKYISFVEQKFKSKEFGYIRVIVNSAEAKNILRRLTQTRWPNLVYSSETKDRFDNKDVAISAIHLTKYPVLTKENVESLIHDYLKTNQKLSESVANEVLKVYRELN